MEISSHISGQPYKIHYPFSLKSSFRLNWYILRSKCKVLGAAHMRHYECLASIGS